MLFRSQSTNKDFHHKNLTDSNGRRLSGKVELPRRFRELLFRLIVELQPSAIVHYGPALGVNLAALALGNKVSPVYLISEEQQYELFIDELLQVEGITNIHYAKENQVPLIRPEFFFVNYPDNADRSRAIIGNCINTHGDNDVVIFRGIHQSKEMEMIWQQMIDSKSVRLSLDLFEIGIAFFRKGLQKENFIYRFIGFTLQPESNLTYEGK